jgi:uncharacterized surface protein with fasciclin (FAS1) repeats
MDPQPNQPDDGSLASRMSSSGAAAEKRVAISTTVHRRRVVEKVGVGRKVVWWPLLLLPLIPAIVAAISFEDAKGSDKVAAPVAVETSAGGGSVAESSVADSSAAAVPVTEVATTDSTAVAAPASDAAVATEAVPTTIAEPVTTTTIARTSVTQVAKGIGKISAAIDTAGLTATLDGPGPFTVFAPSDGAFDGLPAGALSELLKPENHDALGQLLRYHVVPGRLEVADLKTGSFATIDGTKVGLTADGTQVTLTDTNGITAVVQVPGLPADNGIVYVIDHVLLPPGFTLPGQKNQAGDAVLEDLTVYFDSGSDALNAAANAKVQKAVEILKALPAGSKVALIGHADKQGDPVKNQALSERRVNNVQDALKTQLGAAAGNITFSVDHRGDTEPAENLAKSRRVTIEIQQ